MADLVREGKVRLLDLSEAGTETIRRAHDVHPLPRCNRNTRFGRAIPKRKFSVPAARSASGLCRTARLAADF